MTYFISLCIDKKIFGVVFEGSMSPSNLNRPDVVIYSGDIKTTTVVVNEISVETDLQKTYSTTKLLASTSSKKNIFVPESNR